MNDEKKVMVRVSTMHHPASAYVLGTYASSTGSKLIRVRVPTHAPEIPSIQTGFLSAQAPGMMTMIASTLEQPKEKTDLINVQAEGIPVPDIQTRQSIKEVENMDIKTINIKYPLIPSSPRSGEEVLAFAHIYYHLGLNELVYTVNEPQITDRQKKLVAEIKEYVEEKVDINFAEIKKKEATEYLTKIIDSAMRKIGVGKDEATRKVIRYYIIRDFMGLQKIEPLIQDKMIEDVSCDGIRIPLYVYHRDPRVGSIRTNIFFENQQELDSFVNRVAERCGKSLSLANPLLDGTLPDGSRVQATLGSDIARRGSNFTIRMFTERPMTPVDLLKLGTCDLKMMAYYWMCVEYGLSILISGGTATGKTSLLNVLSLFIKPQMKIVSIEDTAELRLTHMHWIPQVARTVISEEGNVDMFKLLAESLRQRPDYIIVGEVRGKEAYVLFQQMAVGHAGLATIHAENFQKLMDRLTTPPISLVPSLIQNVDLIMFVKRVKQGRKYLRRIQTTTEVMGYDTDKGAPIVNDLFTWKTHGDTFDIVNKSHLLKKIADTSGMSDADIGKDLVKRSKILQWLVQKNITDYQKVSSIINLFYTSSEFLMEKIEGGL
ncbi:MAG: type II/IV secretion system ATPase subunit [Candidatus Aenigmarchaeota archaeon]|nr:type II/IV secretion system ATPase subunit [Candidatus Aenigmarchaeota archaeon]